MRRRCTPRQLRKVKTCTPDRRQCTCGAWSCPHRRRPRDHRPTPDSSRDCRSISIRMVRPSTRGRLPNRCARSLRPRTRWHPECRPIHCSGRRNSSRRTDKGRPKRTVHRARRPGRCWVPSTRSSRAHRSTAGIRPRPHSSSQLRSLVPPLCGHPHRRRTRSRPRRTSAPRACKTTARRFRRRSSGPPCKEPPSTPFRQSCTCVIDRFPRTPSCPAGIPWPRSVRPEPGPIGRSVGLRRGSRQPSHTRRTRRGPNRIPAPQPSTPGWKHTRGVGARTRCRDTRRRPRSPRHRCSPRSIPASASRLARGTAGSWYTT